MEKFTGCLKSLIDARDYKICCSTEEQLPEEFEVSVLPRVKNQKSISSCVAHSTSSILEYHELLSGRKNNLSTNFIYGIQKSECGREGRGMYLRDACKIASKYGDMLESDCPGNTEVPDCWEVAESALSNEYKKQLAEGFRIKSYFSCTTPEAIKKAIKNYGPVLAAIKWYKSYVPDKNGVLPTTQIGDNGYHAIMIYGWNKTGFKCQNSWGKYWGKDGRFVLPYSIKISEARGFVDELDDDISVPNRNGFLDIIYAIINFILNIFRK